MLNVWTADTRARRRLLVPAAAAVLAVALSAGCGGGGEDGAAPATAAAAATDAATPAESAAADLTGVKDYLLQHTRLLAGFTGEFLAAAREYGGLAEAAGFDYERLWEESADEVGPLVQRMKDLWIEGNPYYERVEGIVAGTPSLAEFDVALDAGANGAEDPGSAVPFDLTLSDGRVLKQPGNFYNITEGALWGTLPADVAAEVPSTPADLDGDGAVAFGEVLPDAMLLLSATEGFDRYARDLAASADAWQPSPSDAFTALVTMVPTMSEYFGQWKVSRFVLGDEASGEAFNVVSRLSDINDILTGLQVIYGGVEPLVARSSEAQSKQTGSELGDLKAFIEDLYAQEQSGRRFQPEEADILGEEAQQRGDAVAGQVSQIAAALGVEIEQ